MVLEFYEKVKNSSLLRNKKDLVLSMGFAGFAGAIADHVVHPLTTLKVRRQLAGERQFRFSPDQFHMTKLQQRPPVSTWRIAQSMYMTEGLHSFYLGYFSGIFRQMISSGIRFGIYDYLKLRYKENSEFRLPHKVLTASLSAVLASILTLPGTIVKLRFQSRPKEIARYKSIKDAHVSIYRSDGIAGFWKGGYFSIMRLTLTHLTEILCFDYTVKYCMRMDVHEPYKMYFISATLTAICSTLLTTPFDVLQTRSMCQLPNQYANNWDCVHSLYREEGVRGFYRGSPLMFARVLCWNLVFWSILRSGVFNILFPNSTLPHFTSLKTKLSLSKEKSKLKREAEAQKAINSTAAPATPETKRQ